MSSAEDILFALEKTVYQVVSSAQASCRTSPDGEQITGWLYEVTNHLQQAVDSHRTGSGAGEESLQALTRLADALGRLRTLLPRGTDTSERVALARWLCDAARTGLQPTGAR